MKPLAFMGQVHDVRLKRHGGRITIDFGVDAIDAINEISKFTSKKDMNLTFAVMDPDAVVEERHDEETE